MLPFTDAASVRGQVAGIGFGANIGPALQTLQDAWRRVQQHPRIHPLTISSPYRSRPVDMNSTNWFINAVALIRTTLPPQALLHLLQTIEEEFGRTRILSGSVPQDRTLDLDLLFYADCRMQTETLTLPHPRMAKRLFVLDPLAEIAGDLILPSTDQPVRTVRDSLRLGAANQQVEKSCWPS
ncbi:2-amino-4-hydroxy-6-hydroxymethyldihydropteridine diphosphokinase [Desulfobulbus alkaliphilus]|nr:2-amino-4-hydroxy-6-hydroxymethyldihydropteridine diphosphokinase [Desulfobulbus alkaliphilus]